MRIVGGQLRGRQITAPSGRETRPSTDRLRESLFNILEHRGSGLQGVRVLDLFAGSGALGLEALSRGAQFALFVDTNAQARGAIRENIEALGLTGQTRLFRRDAKDLGPIPANVGAPFDLVFMDPPYADTETDIVVDSVLSGGWAHKETLFVIERGTKELPLEKSALQLTDQRRYGDSHLFFYQSEES